MIFQNQELEIDRHKAAIVRSEISRPVRLGIEAGFFESGCTFFDYGCGHGGDIERIKSLGFDSRGWDPYFRPESPKTESDIVNIGFVLNVIENPVERSAALKEAWSLTKKILIVSAQVLLDYLSDKVIAYGDGVITRRNTFQKYFNQDELKNYIDAVLDVDSIPMGLGIYAVFKSSDDAENFRVLRFRSRRAAPVVRRLARTFEAYQALLQPLINFVSYRGRVPAKGELPEENAILQEFGSYNRAFKLILQVTNRDEWDALIERRKQDLLLYIALSKFSKRPKRGQLPIQVLNDVKALLGTYKDACELADQALFGIGQAGFIQKVCSASRIGKFVPDGLYVHVSALNELDLSLRLYEGCASRTVGRMDGATLVKFHTDKPKISYLFYPNFDSDPHPALQTSVRIDLRDLHVSYSDYESSVNPPILHRKETFVAKTYPFYERFSELTRQEVELGLLENSRSIGNAKAWQKRLEVKGVEIKEHHLLWKSSQSRCVEALPRTAEELSDENLPVDDVTVTSPSEKLTETNYRMSKDELEKFLRGKMSTTTIYQSVIMRCLLEGNGVASADSIAKQCEVIGDKSAASYRAALLKYPKQALEKHGVLITGGKSEFILACNLDLLTVEDRQSLIAICNHKLDDSRKKIENLD